MASQRHTDQQLCYLNRLEYKYIIHLRFGKKRKQIGFEICIYDKEVHIIGVTTSEIINDGIYIYIRHLYCFA